MTPLTLLLALTPQLQDTESIDLEVARAAFGQLKAITAADGGALWGASLDYPVLFVDPTTRELVANRADEEGLLTEEVGVWRGLYPADKPVANFATEWAGRRWTMLIWPLPTDEVSRARLLLHESFHNAQFDLNVGGASNPAPHMATLGGRLWLRLEARALAAALNAEPEGLDRADAAADALVFRALRRSMFPGSAEAEDQLERLEGSAEYTGMRLCSPDEGVRIATTVELLEGLGDRPSLARSFMYATGPALGLLLDGYDPLWRKDFLGGASFTTLLKPAVWMEDPEDLQVEALKRARSYGLAEIEADEERREQERLARLARHRARFLDGPVLILPARSPNLTFDPNRIDLFAGVGAVYGTLWLSDAWGVAEATGGALVLADRRVHLAAPTEIEGPELAGDGWTLELDPGWRVIPGERAGDYRVVEGE